MREFRVQAFSDLGFRTKKKINFGLLQQNKQTNALMAFAIKTALINTWQGKFKMCTSNI